jgi:CRISPR-associated endonuclease Cas3-HD
MNSTYCLLPENECFSKSYKGYLETYATHVNACTSFLKPVMNIFRSKLEYDYLESIIRLHDIGKRGEEFQKSIIRGKAQNIRHEELAFILWLDNHPDLKTLDEPQILAILAHHRTLIDEESAIRIEKYISEHEKMEEMSEKWINMLRNPRENRIDTKLLLPALKLVDILRTIDVLASYTTETVLHLHLNLENHDSLFASSYSKISRELSSVNLRVDEIDFEESEISEETTKIQILRPINLIAEYRRRRRE